MKTAARLIQTLAHPLVGTERNYDPLLQLVGEAKIVVLGAQTHGTHEFCSERAQITRRLIIEKGFQAIALEGDWPDVSRLNEYVRGNGIDPDSNSALSGFTAFPAWLWRNADMLDFIGWLKSWNDLREDQSEKAGIYGLDLYGLHKSIAEVVSGLKKIDPTMASEIKECYRCFEEANGGRRYGFAADIGIRKSCEEEALKALVELRRKRAEITRKAGKTFDEELFSAEQNAYLVEDAERYYRAMFRDRTMAWNLREVHMQRAAQLLMRHLEKNHAAPKLVIWVHNLHAGDARAEEPSVAAKINLGQLLREQYGHEVVLVGFTTHSGTVTAALDWWDSPPEQLVLPPAIQGSHEEVFHELDSPDFMLNLRSNRIQLLAEPRLQRTVGIVYRPDMEIDHQYFKVRLNAQFDAILHFDKTRAVEPIEHTTGWDRAEMPETFPTGV